MQSEVIALVSVWLFAAHHGCWCYLATVSAVWDCVSGWHLCQRLHVMTRLVEDYDGWLRLLANVMWSIMKDGMRDFFGYYLNNKGYVRKSSNKLQVGLWRRSGCSFGTLGYGALFPFTLMATTNMDLWHVLWRTWRGSHTQGFFKTTGARWGPTLGVVIARGLGSSGIIRSGGVWCVCSGTTRKRPRSGLIGAVRFAFLEGPWWCGSHW